MNLSTVIITTIIGSMAAWSYAGPTPDWVRNRAIYEVNIRQFDPQGSFRAIEDALPRIAATGAGIVWLMPIHPIGIEKRKGSLGSYYSVRDYFDVNPEFGTKADFRSLVNKAHQLGLYVIIDWVANHTAWDNPWARHHPDFYTKDSNGSFVPPVSDWNDVIDLNYDNPALREEMIKALEYWVREFDIDGYRCDVASMVPTDFWKSARQRLDRIKPVFMLAESSSGDLLDGAFDALYGSELFKSACDLASRQKNANDIWREIENQLKNYPANTNFMQFTSNHDENSWTGDLYDRLGDASAVFNVIAATIPGTPLIYGGQEAGLNKRLNFFERDTIAWRDHWFFGMFSSLFNLKKTNPALQSGPNTGTIRRLKTELDNEVLAFVRQKDQNAVVVITNLSDRHVWFSINNLEISGTFRDIMIDTNVDIANGKSFDLVPWGYRVFAK